MQDFGLATSFGKQGTIFNIATFTRRYVLVKGKSLDQACMSWRVFQVFD
jgi:hypothetical protein